MRRSTRQRGRAGFTIIELLTVIGIIVILVGILLPVLSTVRRKGYEAKTGNQINKIQAACQNYYLDFRAYPGPLPDYNMKGYGGTFISAPNSSTNPGGIVGGIVDITSSQNLVLGLIGGLKWNTSGSGQSSSSGPTYDVSLVGNGPRSLTQANPQLFPPYIDFNKYEISDDGSGHYISWCVANNPNGKTLVAPEFLDSFSVPFPLIYLRARVGGQTIADNPDSQYFTAEMAMYWRGGDPPSFSNAPFPSTSDPANNGMPVWPASNGTPFFANPAINDQHTPRSRDSFIIISAGYDGLYGTKDDIMYSN